MNLVHEEYTRKYAQMHWCGDVVDLYEMHNGIKYHWIKYKYCTDLDWFKNPNLKRDWSTMTYSVTWATMLKQEQRRETTGWKANSLTTAVSSKVK